MYTVLTFVRLSPPWDGCEALTVNSFRDLNKPNTPQGSRCLEPFPAAHLPASAQCCRLGGSVTASPAGLSCWHLAVLITPHFSLTQHDW